MNIAVGLSGGVDSSVAALLLKEQGHDVVGITMKLWRPGLYKGGDHDSCFGPGEEEDIRRAAAVSERIGIPFHVFDCFDAYRREVLAYFRESYLAGRTPNPCVRCNALVKFGLLPRLARESGLVFDHFATGHYARIGRHGGRFSLLRARDRSKDQSYFLYRLSQEQLARQLFPLGDLSKTEIRAIARAHGFGNADAPDSQDFYSGDRAELIGEADREGEVVDTAGRVVGRHPGFWHFTIGQRKGLGTGGGNGVPYYVVALDAANNRVIVGTAADCVRREIAVDDMAYVGLAPEDVPEDGVECLVKIRSAGEPRGPARLFPDGRCLLPSGISGVAPGQSAVFYAADAEEVLCGGILR
jgi:tRNA-specific 2-thiouridylase